jgi:hypothetical protein
VKWLDKYDVLNEADIPGLEAQAAVHEFKERLPREEAEKLAYQGYVRSHAVQAMAYHYQGGKIAKILNDEDSAQQHGKAYESAAATAGFDMGFVPPEVIEQTKAQNSLYKFRAHPSDVFFPVQEAPRQAVLSDAEKVMKLIEGLKNLRGVI